MSLTSLLWLEFWIGPLVWFTSMCADFDLTDLRECRFGKKNNCDDLQHRYESSMS